MGRWGNHVCAGWLGTRACGDANTRACGAANARACGDTNTRACGDANTRACGDANTRACGVAKVASAIASGLGRCESVELLLDFCQRGRGALQALAHLIDDSFRRTCNKAWSRQPASFPGDFRFQTCNLLG